MKLRRLRAKLRKLKAEYQYSEDEEQSEKSEMDTLQDLKRATEQAIRELQVEAAKANKRKGRHKSHDRFIKEYNTKYFTFLVYHM